MNREAEIGIVYESEGLQAAFDYIEHKFLPLFIPNYANGLPEQVVSRRKYLVISQISNALHSKSAHQYGVREFLRRQFDRLTTGQGTWLPVSSAVTYVYTLLRPAVAEHLAHPIA